MKGKQDSGIDSVPLSPLRFKFYSPPKKQPSSLLTFPPQLIKYNISSPPPQNANPNSKSPQPLICDPLLRSFQSFGTKSCAHLDARPQSQVVTPNQQDKIATPKDNSAVKKPHFLNSLSQLKEKRSRNRSENEDKQVGQFHKDILSKNRSKVNSPVYGRGSQRMIHIPKINFSNKTSESSNRQKSPPYALSEMEKSSGSNGRSEKQGSKVHQNQLIVPREHRPKAQSLQKSFSNKNLSKVPSFIRLKQQQNEEGGKKCDLYPKNELQRQEECVGFEIKISIKPAVKKRSFQDFRIIKQLGTGSFGKACLAIQKKLGFICVIKIIQKNMVNDYEIKSLMRQIKIQSFLSHFHTTNLYGFFDDEEKVYLILELLPTGNLKSQTKGKALPQSRVSNIIFQVLTAIDYMHNNSIIHRDIKPQNIFTFDNYMRVGDFGCAVYCDQMRTSFVGSPCYLSPEQLRKEDYDDKVDVWEVGVMTYELLYKVSPFQRDILAIIQGEQPAQLSQLYFPLKGTVSEQAKDFMRKSLSKQAQSRLSIREAISHQFFKAHRQQYQTLTSTHI